MVEDKILKGTEEIKPELFHPAKLGLYSLWNNSPLPPFHLSTFYLHESRYSRWLRHGITMDLSFVTDLFHLAQCPEGLISILFFLKWLICFRRFQINTDFSRQMLSFNKADICVCRSERRGDWYKEMECRLTDTMANWALCNFFIPFVGIKIE